MNIYIGNLAREVTEDELRALFEPFGEVTRVVIIKDRYSGESRGFGFVEMPSRAAAEKAMKELDGKEFRGRNLRVNEARPRTERRKTRGW